jgi:hypothetical protein
MVDGGTVVRAARREVPGKYAMFSFLPQRLEPSWAEHRIRTLRVRSELHFAGAGANLCQRGSLPARRQGSGRAVACALVRCRGASRLGGALSAKKKRGSATAGG